jgi:hypothetical protein
MHPFEAVDSYLTVRYGYALEDALCEGCLTGKLPGLLAVDALIIR